VSATLDVVHVYEVEGEYEATLTVVDDEGLTASASVPIVVRPQPSLSVEPPSFRALVRAHRVRTETLRIENTGEASLEYTIRVETSQGTAAVPAEDLPPWEPGSKEAVDPRGGRLHPQGFGGPDAFGYLWRDSDEASGPAFEWVEISGVGTRLLLSEDGFESVELPWPFPFYGQEKQHVVISANGYLTFGTTGGDYTNDPIPSSSTPNDLLAVWWDDLSPQRGDGAVYYHHDPAGDRFIVQWTDVQRYPGRGSHTFQAILYPDGRVVYQYLEMAFGEPGDEASATIGIENADGTDGLEVLFNAAGYIHDGLAIAFWPYRWLAVEPQAGTVEPGEAADVEVVMDLTPVAGGILNGVLLLESNDLLQPQARVPVQVEVLANQPPVIDAAGVNPSQGPLGTTFQFVAAANDPDGSIADIYWDFGDGSGPVHAFVATHAYASEGVYTATFTAVDNDGYRSSASVTVRVQQPPQARWGPRQLFMEVAAGQSTSATLTLSNDGAGPLVFGSAEEGTRWVATPERLAAPHEVQEPDARTAEGLYAPNPDPERSPWLPEAVGDVITSWPAPAPIGLAWGVGVNWRTGHLVISDPDLLQDFVVPPDGSAPVASWPTPWAGAWPGDMAFDGTTIWQVNVGGDNGLYRLDPMTGEVLASITSVPWGISQRGLAYDPETDTFFVGGWNEDVIYRVAGLSHPNPGTLVESWSMPVGIAGLAYHPNAGILIVASNAAPDMIYFVDVATRTTVAQFPHPAQGSYGGAGIELDADGRLWVASQTDNRLYLVETGLGPVSGWLRWQPESGEVPPGGSMAITVTVDASTLQVGEHQGSVVLTTNDPEHPLIMVPVSARVAAPPVIAEATADPTLGEPPLTVRFRAVVIPGDSPLATTLWSFGDGSRADGLEAEHTYTSEGRYEATFTVVDTLGGTASVSLPIEVRLLPSPTVDPTRIETTLTATGVESHTVSLGNVEGNAPLEFRVRVREGAAPVIALPRRVGTVADPDAPTAQGLYEPLAPELAQRIRANVRPDAVGDVLAAWPLPAEIVLGWGVGYDQTKLWISDPEQRKDFWTTPAGQLVGSVDTPWAGSWPADLAYDERHGLIWQVNVGGDNARYGLDPQTGEVVAVIDDPQWSAVSQRGGAYRDHNDTLYVGGWNEDIIYQGKGLSWDQPGQVLAAWSLSGAGISGLAWHPDGLLWVATNSPGDYIYGLDLE
ncbi:MAG: PKD domain-containing protein, partial [Firmicutes bacterium]|nr:PKD domain-containing protein [Bacillota bacterium]